MVVGEKYRSKNREQIIVEQPYHIQYRHSFGEVSKFFKGLHEKKLYGTICRGKEHHMSGEDNLFVPPRADCPECMVPLEEWIELQNEDIRVYTFTTMYFSGENFLDKLPLTLINVEFPRYNNNYSKLISILITNEKDEINIDKKDLKIGMKIKPKFKEMPLEKIDASALYFVPAGIL
ncbi:MAG: hypothetical protein M1481_05900 [Candidatus Thermoplasmatota archaeon]|jgi:uncharacterized OB-fold protein|nr:hypothetical protein [Candidatus Thermoplasmatota archaeon]MCL5962950.1 hypothetical protein [Candidatus Thermoplasmatota archaeon]